MQISISGYFIAGKQPPGYFWEDTDQDQLPSLLRITTAIAVQQSQDLRARSTRYFDRLNDVTTITFDITREHRDISQAENFMLDHRLEVPRQGILRMLAQSALNGPAVVRFIKEALIPDISGTQMGRTTIHSYTITGGAVETIDPST